MKHSFTILPLLALFALSQAWAAVLVKEYHGRMGEHTEIHNPSCHL